MNEGIWIGLGVAFVTTVVLGGFGVWQKLKLEKREREERLGKQS